MPELSQPVQCLHDSIRSIKCLLSVPRNYRILCSFCPYTFPLETSKNFLYLLHYMRNKWKAEGKRCIPSHCPPEREKRGLGSEEWAWHYQWVLVLLGAGLALTARPWQLTEGTRHTRIIEWTGLQGKGVKIKPLTIHRFGCI